MDECPQNIEGHYEGHSKDGDRLTIDFFRDEKKDLFYKMTLESDKANPVTILVNGEKTTFEGLDGYISMGCQSSAIVGISSFKNETYRAQYTLVGDDLTSNVTSPQVFQLKFKRVLSPLGNLHSQ